MVKSSLIALAGFAGLVALSSAAVAAETITYSYDAKGRLVKVVHSGTVNNTLTSTYTHDKADNRKTVKVTGAP